MPAAPPYNRQYNFTNYQSVNPATPLPAAQVDAELNQIKVTLDAMLQNTALIQRSDGALANRSVGSAQLASGLAAGFNFRGAWTLGASYNVADAVFYAGKFYFCLVQNVAVVTPDINTADWQLGADFTALVANSAVASYMAGLPTYSGTGPAPVPTGGLFWNNGILCKAG